MPTYTYIQYTHKSCRLTWSYLNLIEVLSHKVMTMLTGWLTSTLRSTYNYSAGYNACCNIFMQTRNYAARRGTREKRDKLKKKKAKAVVEKVGFIPHNMRNKVVKKTISPLSVIDDSWKREAIDDVWVVKYHQYPVYSLEEAIKCHRELHHPTMMNKPNVPLTAIIDLDLKREKKNRFVEKFARVVDTPHTFKQVGELRTVLAFCKSPTEQENARNAGADFVGGAELIKQIQTGAFTFREYQHIIAHADILTDLLLIRGLLKRKFPNIKAGTLGNDMSKLITRFKDGIHYTAVPDAVHKEYGRIDAVFGLLDMDTKQLEENFDSLLKDIEVMKPKPDESYIKRYTSVEW
ncbi:uncharacterized protein LOC108626589 [Ceratina calcarata]|uniref:Uncharacterized protein LOC108626589 n=1 Tax=Ceratina calcarata TaxID=156304 RepID=A0AAJ7J2W9_9HYME|nr:uncharacterized protein LOC108626589 [Ceratina calcarata]